MNFRIEYNEFNDYGIPIYRKSEQAFDFQPCVNSDFSLMLGSSYTSLELNLNNKKVLCLSGINPMKTWTKSKIDIPFFKKGTLFVEGLKDCFPGMGVETHNQFAAFYDPINRWICLSSNYKSEYTHCVMFANNTIAALDNNTIVAIWIKPKFIN